MGKKVLIATLYSPEPVLLAATRLGAEILYLLIDKEPDKQQETSLELIKESLGKVIDVKAVKTEVYDIVAVAERVVELIDSQPKDETLYVNVTSGRKTKALGVLYAAYARIDKIKKIAYNPEEDEKAVVYLPKLCFKLTDSQKVILNIIGKQQFESITGLAKKVKMSRAMLYRNIDELKDLGYVDTEKGIKLTDAGRIARL